MDKLKLGLLLTSVSFLLAFLSTLITVYFINVALSIPPLNFSSPSAFINSLKSYLEGLILSYYYSTFPLLTAGFIIAVLGQMISASGFSRNNMTLGFVTSILGSLGGVLFLVAGLGISYIISLLVKTYLVIPAVLGLLGIFAYFLYVFTLNVLYGVQFIISGSILSGILLIACTIMQFINLHLLLTQTGQLLQLAIEFLLFLAYLLSVRKI